MFGGALVNTETSGLNVHHITFLFCCVQSCDAVLSLAPAHEGALSERIKVLLKDEQWNAAVSKAKEALHAHPRAAQFHEVSNDSVPLGRPPVVQTDSCK